MASLVFGKPSTTKEAVMKRPSFKAAVAWIALNDNPGDEDDWEALKGYISVALVADLFDITCGQVADRIQVYRKAKMGIEPKGGAFPDGES